MTAPRQDGRPRCEGRRTDGAPCRATPLRGEVFCIAHHPDRAEAQARQRAALVPGAGAWEPGSAPHLEHGLRSRRPGPAVLDPLAREVEDALADDLPLKDAEGHVPAPDRFAVELAAIALLRVRRCSAYLELRGDADERGNLRPAFVELGKAVEHAARMLDRLGMSPRARAALGVDVGRARQFDLARHWAEQDAAEEAGDG